MASCLGYRTVWETDLQPAPHTDIQTQTRMRVFVLIFVGTVHAFYRHNSKTNYARPNPCLAGTCYLTYRHVTQQIYTIFGIFSFLIPFTDFHKIQIPLVTRKKAPQLQSKRYLLHCGGHLVFQNVMYTFPYVYERERETRTHRNMLRHVASDVEYGCAGTIASWASHGGNGDAHLSSSPYTAHFLNTNLLTALCSDLHRCSYFYLFYFFSLLLLS